MPSSREMYKLLKVCYDKRTLLAYIFILNHILESFSIDIFYFPYIFVNIFIFLNLKYYFPPLIKGFSIFTKSLEAFDQFISFPVYIFFSSIISAFLIYKY